MIWITIFGLLVGVAAPTKAAATQSEELKEAERLINRAGELYREGKYSEAIPLAESALAIRERVLGPDHPDVATVLGGLAEIYRASGNYEKPGPLFERALAINEKALGPDQPDLAISLNNLAEFYRIQGEYEKAEPLYQRALAIFEKSKGPDHPFFATSLTNLAEFYKAKGDYPKAKPLYLRALAIREKALGRNHLDVADSLKGLALLCYEMGDYKEAEAHFLRAGAIFEKELGPNHPDVAMNLTGLAFVYQNRGEYEKAEPLLKRSMDIFEKVLGPNHTDYAASLNNLAEFYRVKGDYNNAEAFYQRALNIDEKALGADHPDVALVLGNFAGLYRERGNYNKAEALLLRALAIREKTLGQGHPYTAISLNTLANIYVDKGDHSRAEILFKRAIATGEKTLGAEHPYLASLLQNFAGLYYAIGDYNNAKLLFQRAQHISEKMLGTQHPEFALLLSSLATIYNKTGEYDKAEPLFDQALAITKKALGENHPNFATILNNAANLYRSKRDYDKAISLLLEALAIREKVLGDKHPGVAQNLNNLAAVYAAKGDAAQAVARAARAGEIQEFNLALIITTGSEEQKRAYMKTLLGTTFGNVSLHIRDARDDIQAARLALTTLLRRKGRVLDTLVENQQVLRGRLSPENQSLLDKLNDKSLQLSALLFRDWGKIEPDEYQRRIAELEEERQKLEATLSARVGVFRAQIQPVTLEIVQKMIPQDAALVEIILYQPFDAKAVKEDEPWGAERYIAYVLEREGEPRWADLGEAAAIDSGVNEFLAALRNPEISDLKERARRLDEKVMRPIRKLLGETRIVLLSPDGQLNKLPFAALVDEDGRYMIERYSLNYLTSGRDLLRLQVRSEGRENPLVIANPAFDEDSSRSAANKSTQSPDRNATTLFNGERRRLQIFEALPATAEEAKQLAAVLNGAKVLTGAQATEAAIKQVRGPGIIHIATHGFFLAHSKQEENPLLRSGLVFAGVNKGRSGSEDGVLTALEAAGLDLWGTKLVVMSACETGLGDIENGEGVYGLRRAIMMAGAESQVMSLWKVGDTVTKDLMIAYYNRLMKGEGRSEALRQVQLEMLRSQQRKHPYYWAGFIASGEWANLQGKR